MWSVSVCTDGGCVAALLRLPLSGMRDLRQRPGKTISEDPRCARGEGLEIKGVVEVGVIGFRKQVVVWMLDIDDDDDDKM